MSTDPKPAPAPDRTLLRGSGPSTLLIVRFKKPIAHRIAAACAQVGRTKAEITRELWDAYLRKVGG